MKRFALSASLVYALSLNLGCGILEDAEDEVAAVEEDLANLEETYNSLNLTCSIDDILGITEAESATTYELADTDCASTDLEEYYMILEDAYDSDDDGTLSDTELATAYEDWTQEYLNNLDTDGDGSVSEAEKTTYKTDKLPGVKEKRAKRFEKVCSDRGETPEDCRKGRGELVAAQKANIKANFSTYDSDSDGTLSDSERTAMKTTRGTARDTARATYKTGADANGDGKLSPEELQNQQTARKTTQTNTRTTNGGAAGDAPKPPPPQ